jgi:hypothetical protein
MSFAYTVFSGESAGSHPAKQVLPGIAMGTKIMTKAGERAVETLQVGDKIVTRCHGFQTLRAVATTAVQSGLAVQMLANVIGRHEATIVSATTRFLVRGDMPQELFGAPAVMVTAVDLVDYENVCWVEQPRVQLVHLMFDTCEIVQCAGLEVETLDPAIHAIGGFAAQPLHLVEMPKPAPLTTVQRRVRSMLMNLEMAE